MLTTPCLGCRHSTLRQYDTNSGEITQEYDQHLGPVNTITFVDENRRFVTTSDDKTIRAWDFDIPVVIKYIAEPHMHSMPAVTLHPSSTSMLGYFLTSSDATQRNTLLLSHWITRYLSTARTTSVKTAKSVSPVIRSLGTHVRLASPRMASG
jgi:WD40 repeat protein